MNVIPLFRAEAIEFQRDSAWAGNVVPAPPAAMNLILFLVLGIVTFAIFLALGTFARKETVPGFLTPALGVARVLPPHAGTITAVLVVEGQSVSGGDPLLTVRVGQSSDSGQDTENEVLEALGHQRAALLEQIALATARVEADTKRLRNAIAQLETEIEASKQDLATQKERTQLAIESISSARGLVGKGLVSEIEFKHRQDNWLAQRQNETAMIRAFAEKQTAVEQQRHDLERLPDATAEKISTLIASKAEVDAKIAETEGRRAFLLRAPIAGRVSALQAQVGGVADPTIPALVVVPDGDPLQAVLLVGPRAIGFVAPGQAVHISLDAFPYQHFGFQRGKILSVSRSLLRPAELTGPVVSHDPAFRVTVALDRQVIDAYGRQVPLGADMTLSADIILDRRPLLQWILSPLLEARVASQ